MADISTYDYVNEFLRSEKSFIRPQLVLTNGYTMSIQASEFHNSIPRENYEDTYTHVELYAENTSFFDEWGAEGGKYPASYVPVEVVNEFIRNKGLL